MKTNYKNYIITLLLWCVAFPLLRAQTQPEPLIKDKWELNTPESTTKKYIARDAIKLQSGNSTNFSFKAETGKSFSAKIDPGLLFPPTDKTYAVTASDGTVSYNSTNGAVVGSIPGQFAVSPTGAATYSIPIEVPAGINGMQPSVSLVYNSQGGNGIAGWGWNIGGLSMISRVPKNHYYDNEKSGMIWDNTSPLALDGQRLIEIQRWSTDSVEYDTEAKSGNRIVGYNIKDWGVEYFKVYTKSGQIIQYGNPENLASYNPIEGYINPALYHNAFVNLGWFVSKIFDSNQNTINFYYSNNNKETIDNDCISGHYVYTPRGSDFICDKWADYYTITYSNNVLERIEYGGNLNIAKPNDLRIEFDYNDKLQSERITNLVAGKEIINNKIINKITTFTNTEIIQTYLPIFTTYNEKSCLTALESINKDNEKLIPTTIKWGLDNNVVSVSNTDFDNYSWYYSEVTDKRFDAVDVDLDGKSEIIETYRRTNYTIREENNVSSSYEDRLRVYKLKMENNSIVYDKILSDNSIFPNITFSSKDFLRNGPATYLNNGKAKSKAIYYPIFEKNNGTSYFQFRNYHTNTRINYPLKYNDQMMPAHGSGDINNDGIDELIVYENFSNSSGDLPKDAGKIIYMQDNPSNLAIEPVILKDFNSTVTFKNSIKQILVFDFDNDGLNDLLFIGDNCLYFFRNKGGSIGSDGLVNVSFTHATNIYYTPNNMSIIKPADFNGDGSLDMIIYDGLNNFRILTNTGNFNFSGRTISNITLNEDRFDARNNDRNDNKDNFIITDFNHDGKSDIIIIDANYHKECSWMLLGACMNPYTAYDNTTIKWYASKGTTFDEVNSFVVNDENYYFRANSAIGDFDGDGREDVFNYKSNIYNTENTQDYKGFFHTSFNSNFEAKQIKEISNPLLGKTTINYRPLTYSKKSDNTEFYTQENNAVYPFTDIIMPLYCVENVTNALGQVTDYSYSGAKVHLLGKGYLGFKSLTISNKVADLKTTSTTELDVSSCLVSKQTSISSFISNPSKVVSDSEVIIENTKFGKTYTSVQSKLTETNSLTGLSTKTEYLEYDNWLNPKSIKTTKGGLVENQTISYIQKGAWCPNKPEIITSTTKYNGDSISHKKVLAYDVKGNLTSETINPNDDKFKTKTEYTQYDDFGHPEIVKVTARDKYKNEHTRTSTVKYKPNGRLVDYKINLLGEKTTYNWDETKGLLNSQTVTDAANKWSKTTSYLYDYWGEIKETRYPDGNRETSVLQWAGNTGPSGSAYYSYSQTSGNAPVTVWYDGLGREIQKDTYGLNNKKISVSTEYYTTGADRGKLYRVSEPYFENETKTWATTYDDYDEYGRVIKVTTPMGESITDYNEAMVTKVTSPEGTQSSKINSSGFTEWTDVNGKKVNFDYYPNGLTKTTTPQDGVALAMEYNVQGKRTKLTDPDAGIIETVYNGFGELEEERQLIHKNAASPTVTVNNYDYSTGLLNNINRNGEVTEYTYDTDLGYKGRIKSIKIATDRHIQEFTYDNHSRVTNIKETLKESNNTKVFNTGTQYDALGRVKKETYPTGYYTVNIYDNYSNLIETKDGSGRQLWKAVAENARGQLTEEQKGGRSINYGFDNRGLPETIKSGSIVDMKFHFNTKANLEYRIDNVKNQSEYFEYDALNRLKTWTPMNGKFGGPTISIDYNAVGNITKKDDLGNYTFAYGEGNGKPHALTSINGIPSVFPQPTHTNKIINLDVTYTDFKKIKKLEELGKTYELTYGVDDQRRKSVYKENGVTKLTRYYVGNYEEEIDALGNVRQIHYLSGAILIRANGVETLYYSYSDYQGSLIALTDANGTLVERYAFDPWGARRNPNNWTETDSRTTWIVNRGYTGHEHLDAFGIINMNGRVYDPLTAMFFSPDPYVQAPDNWLNYNRYGYVFGNPFKYTDPDGNNPILIAAIIIGATAGGYTGYKIADAKGYDFSDWQTYGYILGGAAIGGISGYAGASIAAGGGFMANTMGIMYSSSFNSIGMSVLSDGMIQPSISFGVASYNLESGEWGYFGKKNNSVLENIGYGSGALGNITDVVSLFGGGTNVNAITEKKDVISHAAVTGDDINISVGPQGGGYFDKNQSLGGQIKNLFKKVPGDGDWENHLNDGHGWKLPINNVNKKVLGNLSDNLALGKNFEGNPLQYSGVGNSCVSYASRALWAVGVPNIGLHPYLWQASLFLRQLGIYSSPYFYQIPRY